MTSWVWIVVGLLVIAAGACWQAYGLASRSRTRGRESLRARRAALWRRRQQEHEEQEARRRDA